MTDLCQPIAFQPSGEISLSSKSGSPSGAPKTFIARKRPRISAVSTALAESRAFITEISHYGDPETELFFMRTVFRPTGESVKTLEEFDAVLAPIARRFEMDLALHAADRRTTSGWTRRTSRSPACDATRRTSQIAARSVTV